MITHSRSCLNLLASPGCALPTCRIGLLLQACLNFIFISALVMAFLLGMSYSARSASSHSSSPRHSFFGLPRIVGFVCMYFSYCITSSGSSRRAAANRSAALWPLCRMANLLLVSDALPCGSKSLQSKCSKWSNTARAPTSAACSLSVPGGSPTQRQNFS